MKTGAAGEKMVGVSEGGCFGFWELGMGEGFHERAEVGGGAAEEAARHGIEVRDDGEVYFWW